MWVNYNISQTWHWPTLGIHQFTGKKIGQASFTIGFSAFFWDVFLGKKTRKNQLSNPLSGWWLTYPPEKYMKVSWDDDIPNIWKNKSHVPNHQPDLLLFQILTIINHRLTI